jgi:hypothetical protein
MPLVSLLWHLLWFVQVGLHVSLLLVLIQRRSYQRFPLFVSYITWKALNGVVLLGMNYAPFIDGNQYFAALVVARTVDAVLAFAMISEIFKRLVSSYPVLRDFGIALFRWGTIVLLMIVIALAWFAPAEGQSHIMSGFYVLERTVSAVLCGLLVLLFALPRFVGLVWRSQAFGIALGLGILATISLATSAIQSQIEPIARNQTNEIMELFNQAKYFCSGLVWMAYLLAPERESQIVVKALPENELETWNQELRRLLHQ